MDTLNKLTKAELIALVQRRNAEVCTLRKELGDVKHDAKRAASYTPRTPYTVPAHFVAAREAAMRSGCTVKVAINSGAQP